MNLVSKSSESERDSLSAAVDSGKLEPFQRECINLFVRAAAVLSIPRSVGEIYGLLFASSVPLPMDGIVERLAISKGSASQGLKWLRDVGAVRAEYVAGDRRDHFRAETELRQLVLGYLRESVEPHLDRGTIYLTRIESALRDLPSGEERKFADTRLKKLQRWQRFALKVLPLFLRVAGKF